MRKVVLYSLLLIVGIVLSQSLALLGVGDPKPFRMVVQAVSMVCLAFIMIRVGYEFELDKNDPKKYLKDYGVAATAAAFPWLFCALYFVFVLRPAGMPLEWQAIKEASLLSRFAAPTSAGILFSMLIAAGLAHTWTYRRARILAIFDDLDTVLLMIPLKIMMVGLVWQMAVHVVVMVTLLTLAWTRLNTVRMSIRWKATLGYAVVITLVCEVIYYSSFVFSRNLPIQIEVLLPAFVLGAVARKGGAQTASEEKAEERVMTVVVSLFMVLVGLSIPSLHQIGVDVGEVKGLVFHVLMVTLIINLGKMFPLFFYRNEAHWKERLAVCIGLFPRGEVGAGILLLSMSYGIGGRMLAVAVLSLALNLVLSGVFIWWVKGLIISKEPSRAAAAR